MEALVDLTWNVLVKAKSGTENLILGHRSESETPHPKHKSLFLKFGALDMFIVKKVYSFVSCLAKVQNPSNGNLLTRETILSAT